MIHIGLFEGIGGFSLAAQWAGWETLATCETNPFGQRVLKHYWPDAYHHGDIKTLNYDTVNTELSNRFGGGGGEIDLLSSQEVFRANPTALQESDLGKKMIATSGRKCLESFGKFNRNGSWAKMFSALLIGQEGWYSTKCRLTWKLRGTKFNRMYFQLVPSTLPTNANGSGLLPTVLAWDGMRGGQIVTGKTKRQPSGQIYSATLNDLARSSLLPTVQTQGLKVCNKEGKTEFMRLTLLPTPTTMDHMAPKTDKAIIKEMTETRPGRQQLSNLRDVVVRQPERMSKLNLENTAKIILGLLPTPDAASGKTGYMGKNREGKQQNLETVIRNSDSSLNSQLLNPQFVAEMMGFPPNWTELPFQSGEPNPLKPTGTP